VDPSCWSSKNTSIEFSDGTYKGEIDNKGRKHGKGIYTWHDGSTYEGDFKNDARNGNGLFHWKNGESYKGDYLEDDRTGQGLYRWPDGSYYEGSFLRGKRHGLGTFHSVDGAVYVGQWFDDLQHGKGKLTNPNKTTIQAIWKNGKLIAQPSPLPKASTKPKLEKIDIPAPVEEDSPTPANIKVPKLVPPSQVEIIQQNSSKDLKKEPTKLFTKSEEDQIEKTPLQSLQEDDSKVDEVMPKSKLPDSASPTPVKQSLMSLKTGTSLRLTLDDLMNLANKSAGVISFTSAITPTSVLTDLELTRTETWILGIPAMIFLRFAVMIISVSPLSLRLPLMVGLSIVAPLIASSLTEGLSSIFLPEKAV
jgi:hypothetical protein